MKVGSLVECITGSFAFSDGRAIPVGMVFPIKGGVYTVRTICNNFPNQQGVYVTLEEIVNCTNWQGIEYAFSIVAFRELLTGDIQSLVDEIIETTVVSDKLQPA